MTLPKEKPPCWWIGPEFLCWPRACMSCALEELPNTDRVHSKTRRVHPSTYCLGLDPQPWHRDPNLRKLTSHDAV